MDAAPVIAIVDDDASVRRSLLRVVRSAGYNAEAFASARAFLEWLSTGHAACLVLDVQMRGMSGFDLQERLAVPIVFITAHDEACRLKVTRGHRAPGRTAARRRRRRGGRRL